MTNVVPDGSRRIVYDDVDIVAGGRYEYRLGIEGPGGEVFAGEASIEVPGESTLELGDIVLASDELRIALSLARAAPATVEVFDLGGRRRIERRLEGLRAGTQRVHVFGGQRLESGVYFATLRQEARRVARRFVVTR